MNTLNHLLAILQLTWMIVGTVLGIIAAGILLLAILAGVYTVISMWRKV